MKARLLFLLLLVGADGVGTEPRERPRLVPPAEGEENSILIGTGQREREPPGPPGFRSFESYLRAQAWRPVGLGSVAKPPANRPATTEAGDRALSRMPGGAVTEGEVLVLPAVEVTGQKVPAEAVRLADLDRQLRSGEKAAVETWFDAMLNPPFLFGESAQARAARAKRRGEVLGWQKILLLSLEVEKSPVEQARIRADLELLDTIMRSWP